VGPVNQDWIARGLEKARALGAKIIEMAFGSPFYLNALADKIRLEYYRTDRPQPLFVGAIGSIICIPGVPYFPAGYMGEVISVAGVDADGRTVVNSSCKGAKIGGIVGADDSVPVPGGKRTLGMPPGPDPIPVATLGASSGGSATIAGILALIWSKYPTWTRDDVRERLFSSAVPVGEGVQLSAPNAYQAVGGFTFLGMNAPSVVKPGRGFCVSALPRGDGPLAYEWSVSESSSSGETIAPNFKTLCATAGDSGTVRTYSVTVTDLTDGTRHSAVAKVRFGTSVSSCAVPPPPHWPPSPPPCLVRRGG
jgi:hypothetical protein